MVLCACSEPEAPEASATKANQLTQPSCISGQSSCALNTPFGTVDIAFNVRALIAEEAFTLFVLPENHHITSVTGYIEGDDMYMGKIPLFFAALTDSGDQANSLFGSCAQDKMRWKVWLTFDGIDESGNSRSHTVFFTVDSYRNLQTYLKDVGDAQ